MRILLVSSFLPYPLFSGGHVRLYNLLKELSKQHEVTLVCEIRKHQTTKDIEAVKKICKEVFVVQRKKQWSTGVLLKTALSTYPFLLAGHDLPEMKTIIHRLLSKHSFDLIHVETFYVFHNLPQTSLPTVLVEHNIEYKVYERFLQQVPFPVRPLLYIDIEKIKYWEKLSWKQATKVVGVSEVEAKQMRPDGAVVANGVDLASFPYKKPRTGNATMTILFMGDFKWIQNRDTALWIVREIWPEIEKSIQAKLWIVGKHIPENLKKFASEQILFDEHAPEKTSDIYRSADVLLAPIRVGGGTSYKILESMASGVPVITTRLGIEGLNAKKNVHALTGETAKEIVQQMSLLVKDTKLYEKIRKNARTFIEENYSWPVITKKLEEVYESAKK